jgi:hypothetical protein
MVSVDGLGERVQHGLEAAQVTLREPGQRPVLEVGEVLVDPGRGPRASSGQAHGEGAPVLGPDVAADLTTRLQPVQVAGQRGSLVGERPVELGHRGRAGLGQVGEEMGLALGEAQGRLRGLQVQADAVGGAMDEGNELQAGLHAPDSDTTNSE